MAFSKFAARQEIRERIWALGIIDIDNFKRVNDRYGHVVGDRVLKQVAAMLNSGCRPGDYLARFGGEEFVLLMSAHSPDELARFAQALVERCAACDFGDSGHDIGQVTVSIGLHFLDNTTEVDLETSFRMADKALYDAKKSGRNQISLTVTTKSERMAA